MEVSFGAKYIDVAGLRKIADNGIVKVNASIVRLEPEIIGDWYAIEYFADKLSENNSKSNYAVKVCESFNRLIEGNPIGKYLYHYMLTLQNSDFEHLDVEKILGTFLVADKLKFSPKRMKSLNVQTEFVTKIRYLQGSPENYYDNPMRSFSRIGKSITDFVKDKFKNYDIVVHVDKSAIPFYLSQGFELNPNPSASDMMIYHQKNPFSSHTKM